MNLLAALLVESLNRRWYRTAMDILSFRKIRSDYPHQFLVLIDPQEVRLSEREIEVVGAREVQAFESGDEMLEAYRILRRRGVSVTMCTPNYHDRFIVEQVPSARVMGA